MEPVRLAPASSSMLSLAKGSLANASSCRCCRWTARPRRSARRRPPPAAPACRCASARPGRCASRPLRARSRGSPHRPRRRPRPSRQRGPVVFGIRLDPRVGVVAVAVARLFGVVDARDVAAPHGRVDPGAITGVVGQEDRERPLTVRDDQLHTQRRAVVGAEINSRRTSRTVARPSRRLAVTVARTLPGGGGIRPNSQCWTCSRNAVFCRAHSSGVVTGTARPSSCSSSGFGQLRHRRHRIEVRRQLAGAAHPVLPGAVHRVDATGRRRAAGAQDPEQLVERAAARLLGRLAVHRPRQCQDDAEPRKPRTSEHVEWEFTTVRSLGAPAQTLLPPKQQLHLSSVLRGVRTHADDDLGMIARDRLKPPGCRRRARAGSAGQLRSRRRATPGRQRYAPRAWRRGFRGHRGSSSAPVRHRS